MKRKNVCLLTQEYLKGATWVYCYHLASELKKEQIWEPHIIAAEKKDSTESKFGKNISLKLVATSSSKLFYSRNFWRKSSTVVNKIKPEIVHGNMNLLSSLGIKDDYPIIETVHTTFSRERRGAKSEPFHSLSWVEKRVLLLYPWLKKIEMRLLKRARHIIAVSETIKNELMTNYSISEEKITVIPNGVDLTTHHRTSKKLYTKKEDEFVLGFLGRMTAGKGAKLLFPIIRKVKKSIPNVKLLLAGDDLNTRTDIRKIIKNHSLEENIVDFGYIYDIEKKNAFLSSLDVFLLPSSHEGMNLTLLEALACQVPIISTPQAATFDHNDTIILAPREIQDIADKIIELNQNKQTLDTIREKSLKIAEKYSWKETVNLTQKVYEKVLIG
ncbi:MAG: glycosyltransferase family 4 protein [Asgard group archaeon]|nr:glycosyltransferase family 4 protein [Asgard group archaeon]